MEKVKVTHEPVRLYHAMGVILRNMGELGYVGKTHLQ